MERRIFIERSILGSAGACLLPFFFNSCHNKIPVFTTNKKIIIIGAGIAGLGAAKFLDDRGVDVTVLEAQKKVGGRLRTNRSLGIPFDEGASWIHGPKGGNPIMTLADKAGVQTFLTSDDSVEVFDIGGGRYDSAVLVDAEKKFNKILNDLRGDRDSSFATTFLDSYPQYASDRLWMYMLSAYLEFDTGADIADLSSLDFYDDESFPGDDLIVTNGYDRIANYLSRDLNVILESKVNSISYNNSRIKIITDNDEYNADLVLVAVPLGVLKRNSIQFQPGLPSETQKAIDNLDMGSVNKFFCLWDKAFWNTDLQYIGYTSNVKGEFNYFLNLKKFVPANALMTFAFGNYSVETESMDDSEVMHAIMANLETIYGDNIPYPKQFLRTKWSSNEFTFGSYSFCANGSRSSDFDVFKKSVNNRIFFAGEHTSRDYRGTVHGAYLSGIREAKKIIDVLSI